MMKAGDGLAILAFFLAGYLQGSYGGVILCDTSTNGTTGITCQPVTSTDRSNQANPDAGASDSDLCCSNIIYIAVVTVGVFTIPLTICLRVCWIRKIKKQEATYINTVRRRIDSTNEPIVQEPYTIECDAHLCDLMVFPPSYEASSGDSTSNLPPPYEPPPPYTLIYKKENDSGEPG